MKVLPEDLRFILREARMKKGLEIKTLATIIDVSNQAIRTWEDFGQIPSPRNLKRYLDALGVVGENRKRIMSEAAR